MRCFLRLLAVTSLLADAVQALAPPPAIPRRSRLQIQDPANNPTPQYDGIVLSRPPSSTGAAHAVEATSRPAPRFPHRPGRRTTGFIALGDSYSAGIGTGVNGTEHPCRRGIHAHPVLISEDLAALEGEDATSFQFLSCTGSTVDDLLLSSNPSQIAELNETDAADFALLSVGGNDLGFFDIMNSCVFRFYSFYSGTCDEALRSAEMQLESTDFDNHLRLAIMEILDRVHWEKRPLFTITVTGYARFFNAETEECDECSFGIWWRGPKLKRDLRRRMNEMVLAVNDKIRRSVEAINSVFVEPKILFVDYDAEFEGHRFCEPNVTEPDYARNETWFFLVGGPDNADDGRADLSALYETSLPPSHPLIEPEVCLEPTRRSGDGGLMALCMMATAAARDPTLRLARGDGEFSQESMWYVPTSYGQTFHPRTKGQEVIRDQIYKRWEEAIIGEDIL